MKLRREQYLKMIRPYYDADVIKVITGVRRAGKSILLETIREELLEKGIAENHIIYRNLEEMDYEYLQTAADLNKEIKNLITDAGKYYVFLDEIQHVADFEKALASIKSRFGIFRFTFLPMPEKSFLQRKF